MNEGYTHSQQEHMRGTHPVNKNTLTPEFKNTWEVSLGDQEQHRRYTFSDQGNIRCTPSSSARVEWSLAHRSWPWAHPRPHCPNSRWPRRLRCRPAPAGRCPSLRTHCSPWCWDWPLWLDAPGTGRVRRTLARCPRTFQSPGFRSSFLCCSPYRKRNREQARPFRFRSWIASSLSPFGIVCWVVQRRLVRCRGRLDSFHPGPGQGKCWGRFPRPCPEGSSSRPSCSERKTWGKQRSKGKGQGKGSVLRPTEQNTIQSTMTVLWSTMKTTTKTMTTTITTSRITMRRKKNHCLRYSPWTKRSPL